jgi:hypothetical protein
VIHNGSIAGSICRRSVALPGERSGSGVSCVLEPSRRIAIVGGRDGDGGEDTSITSRIFYCM